MVDPGDPAGEHLGAGQHPPQRRDGVPRLDGAGRRLGQERLEGHEAARIHQRDDRFAVPEPTAQMPGGVHPGKSAAHDEDARRLAAHRPGDALGPAAPSLRRADRARLLLGGHAAPADSGKYAHLPFLLAPLLTVAIGSWVTGISPLVRSSGFIGIQLADRDQAQPEVADLGEQPV